MSGDNITKEDIRKWFYDWKASVNRGGMTVVVRNENGKRYRDFNYHGATMAVYSDDNVLWISTGWPDEQIEGDDYRMREWILDAIVSGYDRTYYVKAELSHHITGTIAVNGTAEPVAVWDLYFGIMQKNNAGIYSRKSPLLIVPSRKHLISIPYSEIPF